jgi:aspartyl-tRNA(Asn)/glutamyl-tRNA(Gln) amidotransferase subunit C
MTLIDGTASRAKLAENSPFARLFGDGAPCSGVEALVKAPLARLTHTLEFQEIPMAIDAATVRKVARLARIAEPEERLEGLAQELNGIMAWIEQLAEVDTDGVEPLTSVVAAGLPLREDVVTMGGDPARVTSNAPKSVNNFFVVPKVVE